MAGFMQTMSSSLTYMDKPTLRRHLIETRKLLSTSDHHELSRAIHQRLLETITFGPSARILLYTSLPLLREVDTYELAQTIHQLYPTVSVDMLPFTPTTAFPLLEYSHIIVPVVGFDKHNFRLGMGGGWFDGFLASQPSAQSIGLAYAMSYIQTIYPEPHDIPLELIVTEKEIFYKRSSSPAKL